MSEKFLARGKRKDNEKFAYGNIVFTRSGRAFLLEGNFFTGEKAEGNFETGEIYGTELIPETVGRFTGIRDKNRNRVFEGDIVKHTLFNSKKIRVGYVEYVEKYGAFFIKGSGYSENQMYAFCNFLVIGNIHDNPELIEGGE